jgi:hypothetical protein
MEVFRPRLATAKVTFVLFCLRWNLLKSAILPVFALRLLLTYGAPSLVLLGIIRAGCLLSHRQTVLLMSARLVLHVPQQHAGYRVVFYVRYCPNCNATSKHSSKFLPGTSIQRPAFAVHVY